MNDYTLMYAVLIPVFSAIAICAMILIVSGVIEFVQLHRANKNLGRWMREIEEEGKSPKQRRKEFKRLK